jgi:hypothetical protein
MVASPFGHIYLQSLIASAEARVDLHTSRGHKLRLRIAARRLRKLHAYQEWRSAPADGVPAPSRRVALILVSGAWIGLAAVLGMLELQGTAFGASIGLVAIFALTVVWVVLAVVNLPITDDQEPSDGSSRLPPSGWPERRRAPRGGPIPVFEYLRVAGLNVGDVEAHVSHDR